MPLKFFVIPIMDLEAAEGALNAFLTGRTIVSIERNWVDQGSASFWSICVDYIESGGQKSPQSGRRKRVDYREKLNEEDFILYVKLRDLRKDIAQPEGVPLYNVFSNDQLATMAQRKIRSKNDLESIAGVGDARVEKYGQRFLDFLAEHLGAESETDEPSV